MSVEELNRHLKVRMELDIIEENLLKTLNLVHETRIQNEMLIDHFNTDDNVVSSVDFHRRIKK